MFVKFVDAGGAVVMAAEQFDHKPDAGSTYVLGGAEYRVSGDPPRHEKETRVDR